MLDKMLKIGYFADGPWAHRAFELIANDPTIKICFVVPRADKPDKILIQLANKHNITILLEQKINTESFLSIASSFNCDLFVSMSFNQIFRKKLMSLPKLKTINCHAGCLPYYRGRNILNWALINDEKYFGITVHYIDEGVDTGDIIKQKTFPITDNDNYCSLLNKAYLECGPILYETIKEIQKGKVKSVMQSSIHSIGSFCGRRLPGDEIIDWNQNSRKIFNFIRALSSPGPIATTFLNGYEVKINKAILVKDAPKYINIPGQILSKTEVGYYIKTQDDFIEVAEIQSKIKVRVGDRLGK